MLVEKRTGEEYDEEVEEDLQEEVKFLINSFLFYSFCSKSK